MDKSLYKIAPPETEQIAIIKQSKKFNLTNKRVRQIISIIVYLVLIPVTIFLGIKLFEDRKYNIISLIIALLSCVPFFIGFEKNNKAGARELVIIAVMTALSVVGRLIFAPIPGFKPVTAIVIITAIALGPNAGFLTGAMSAVVSNIFFGQGPWTPIQMFTWGLLGFVTGLIFYKTKEKPNNLLLILIGLVGGVVYSLMMDVWSAINMDGAFNIERYSALILSSLPFMASYAVSNVVFLLLLTKPFLQKLNRVKTKYNLFK